MKDPESNEGAQGPRLSGTKLVTQHKLARWTEVSFTYMYTLCSWLHLTF